MYVAHQFGEYNYYAAPAHVLCLSFKLLHLHVCSVNACTIHIPNMPECTVYIHTHAKCMYILAPLLIPSTLCCNALWGSGLSEEHQLWSGMRQGHACGLLL